MKLDRTPACGALPRMAVEQFQEAVGVAEAAHRRAARPGAECWKDRSKYGATFSVEVSTSISPGRISAGCR